MQRKVKKLEHEKLSEINIHLVISLLEAEKPITKKDACEVLNIKYNTARLAKIIEEHKDLLNHRKIRKQQNRGKPASDLEIKQIIEDYMDGDPITDISKRLFRSVGFIKTVITKLGIPQRPVNIEERTYIGILPEACIAESFIPGQKVWSAKYHKPGLIVKEMSGSYDSKYGSKCYRVYITEKIENLSKYFPNVTIGGYNIYALAYDLGSLNHLETWL